MLNDIQIGPITIHMYGLMIGTGFAAAYFICCLRAKKKQLSEDILWGILLCALAGAIIGTRLLYYIVSIPQILENPSILWNFKNGYVVYGGIIFGVLFGYIYCKKKTYPFCSILILLCHLFPLHRDLVGSDVFLPDAAMDSRQIPGSILFILTPILHQTTFH
ncbi:Phosphatidylglycerol--prolipoprotein diacylglyceryl transferase [Eubacterium plexicaudatum ASF492]|nr:Phosphatidylglycerol--prolipoprotein diacylglyceryl transferase [Eubacterium plexicaudatum ASF492]